MSPGAEARILSAIGEPGLASLVAAFYRLVQTDEVLGPMYTHSLQRTGETWQDAERRLCQFLTFRMGGSTEYIDQRGHPRLRARHMPFQIDAAAAERWVRLMDAAMDETRIPESAAADLRSFFAHTAHFMVNQPPNLPHSSVIQ
jgi:hemoglobin